MKLEAGIPQVEEVVTLERLPRRDLLSSNSNSQTSELADEEESEKASFIPSSDQSSPPTRPRGSASSFWSLLGTSQTISLDAPPSFTVNAKVSLSFVAASPSTSQSSA